jgi:hypothetical protein
LGGMHTSLATASPVVDVWLNFLDRSEWAYVIAMIIRKCMLLVNALRLFGFWSGSEGEAGVAVLTVELQLYT